MTQDHDRLRELFIAACDLPESEQEQFVQENCADPDLRVELKKLLSSDLQTSGFLSDGKTTDGLRFDLETVVETELPSHIGQYEVKSVLGEGGMGVVYLARQQSPNRDVAIKVIRSGMASAELLKRFEFEAEVLGRLTDPRIAQIYEAGIFSDANGHHRPYFAMEHVDGLPLREYVKQRNPDSRERLNLLIEICKAVHHAHQRGVIHRDLKPGNILVKSNGQPVILDFGVARVADEDFKKTKLQTHAGQLIGTLQYMSPEQATGQASDVDTRSDVYSLGVIAFELLSSTLPYEVGDKQYLDAVRAVSEQIPTQLASLHRDFRGDLDTIVHKALEKRPADRYQSTDAFAADIQRFLNHETIVAKKTGFAGRTKKWVQRNTAVASLLGLLALAIAVGFIGMAVQTMKSMESERQAKASEKGTSQMLDILVRSFRSPDPTIAGKDVKMADVLVQAAADLEEDSTLDPLLKARLLFALGQSFTGLGVSNHALTVNQAAWEIRVRELGEEHPVSLDSLLNLGLAHYQAGQYDDAWEIYNRTLDLNLKVLGEEHPNTLAAMHNLSIAHSWRGNMDEAVKLNERAFEIMKRTIGPTNVQTLRAMNSLGQKYMLQGKYDKALSTIEEANRLTKDTLGEKHTTTLYSIDLLAWVYGVVKPVQDTLPMHEEIMARFEDVLGDEHTKTIDGYMNAAVAYIECNQPAETIRLLEKALPKFRQKFSDDHNSTVISAAYLADAYLVEDRPEDALAVLDSLPETATYAKFERGVLSAKALSKMGKPQQASEALDVALANARTDHTEGPEDLAGALAQVAQGFVDVKLFAEAEPLFNESNKLLSDVELPPGSPLPLNVQSGLGAALAGLGRYDDAEPLLLSGAEGLLAERSEPPFPTPREVSDALKRVIQFYELTEQPDQIAFWKKMEDDN